MKKQKSSLLERLKICWYVLTLKNYVYFGIGKDSVVWDKEGKYKELKKSKNKCLSYISGDYKFIANGEETNLHDFMWGCIEKFAKEAKTGKI